MTEQGDPRFALALMNNSFAGHIHKDAVLAESYEPDELAAFHRATVIVLLNPEGPPGQQGRCGVVDLLHAAERDTPRCGNQECRCMQGDA